MKNHKKPLIGWSATFFICSAAAVLPAAAGGSDEKRAAPAETPRSIFEQPNSPKEGRDPFFPNSMRYFASMVVPTAKSKDLSSLVIRGKSGTPDHPLVIINDITFAEGDDRDVITHDGKIHIHCFQIVGDLVVIEANGQHHELRYDPKR